MSLNCFFSLQSIFFITFPFSAFPLYIMKVLSGDRILAHKTARESGNVLEGKQNLNAEYYKTKIFGVIPEIERNISMTYTV